MPNMPVLQTTKSSKSIKTGVFSPFSPRTPKVDVTARKPSTNAQGLKMMSDLKKSLLMPCP